MAKRIAIVGSGPSGLSALWALKSGTNHEVHLFEADSRPGGHLNTATVEAPNDQKIDLDIGSMLLHSAASPNSLRSLAELGISTTPATMTFGLSRDYGSFEWANTSLLSVFTQKANILSPSMWRLLLDVVRFNEFGLDVLQQEEQKNRSDSTTGKIASIGLQETMGEYLDREHYSLRFRHDYLVPVIVRFWTGTSIEQVLQMPTLVLIRFLYSHNLLSLFPISPGWLVLSGGPKRYVQAVLKDVPEDHIHLRSKVTALTPTKRGRVILTAEDKDRAFDHVILAIHADQALDLLRPVASAQEIEILGGFQRSRTVSLLHSDLSFMPKRRKAWAASNCLTESPLPSTESRNASKACVTYNMNLLQHIPEDKFGHIFVTIDPSRMPDPSLAQGIWECSRPTPEPSSVRLQKLLPKIQNIRGISYCGSWTKDGFLEDAASSGLSVAVDHLGAELPFDLVRSPSSSNQKPSSALKRYFARLAILLLHFALLWLEHAWHKTVERVDNAIASKRKTS